MPKTFLAAGAFMGLTAVALGAYGAHGLKPLIGPENVTIWEKGVQYQQYHSLAIVLCYLLLKGEPSTYVRNAAVCFVTGIFCFSGSLYLLAVRGLVPVPTAIVGPITPLGGLFFLAGWSFLLAEAFRKK